MAAASGPEHKQFIDYRLFNGHENVILRCCNAADPHLVRDRL